MIVPKIRTRPGKQLSVAFEPQVPPIHLIPSPKQSASNSPTKKGGTYHIGLTPKALENFKARSQTLLGGNPETFSSLSMLAPVSPKSKSIKLITPIDRERVYNSVELSRRAHKHPDEADDSASYKKQLTIPVVQSDEKVEVEDESPQNILGGTAVNNFYSHYKKLHKVKDVNSFMKVNDAVYTSVLHKSEALNLLPSKIGFIRERGEDNKVKLNHFRLGDKYTEVLSDGLKSIKGFNKLELSNNRITPTGANYLLSKLNNQTEALNLAANSIGKAGCEQLCTVIGLHNSRLLEVSVEGNKLGDVLIAQLCEAVSYSSSLKRLNIGKNFLSDNSAEAIAQMLQLNTTLEELYLQWNQIKSPGGSTIVNGLKAAQKMRVLDMSWNTLGQNGSQFAKNFASYISTNTTLVHLDLSNNYITKQDAQTIADDLRSNHTLYGFHFHGNVGYVDIKGFLIVPDNCEQSVTGRITQPPINGINFHPESLKHHVGNWEEYKDVCWICEGWRPNEVTWTPGVSGAGDTEPIFANFSFEGYNSVYLPKRIGFSNVRMVPPLKFDYMFTVDLVQVLADDHKKGKPQIPLMSVKVEGHERQQIKMETVNSCEKGEPGVVIGPDYEPTAIIKKYNIRPRIPDEMYIPPEVIIIRPEWKFPVSIFRQYKVDNQALLDDCFRVDMENNRISKVVKNPDDYQTVKNTLYDFYKGLKELYKHYAAIGAPSDIWSITLNTYTELCSQSKIIDNKVLKLSDFDRIFIATYTRQDKDRNPRNPDRALVRHQFLEGIVRLSEHKYIGSGVCGTYGEAIKLLLNECLIPYMKNFSQTPWRQEKYWAEGVDTVYKSYFPLLRSAFKKYYGLKTLPGQKKYMALEEFHRLLGDCGMFTSDCGERDATLAYSLSMMTQVDELNSDRIFQMQFVEFLEALGRVCDRFSAYPYGTAINPQTGQPEVEMTYEQRFAQPLHIKIEGVMPAMFAVSGNDVKELWMLPETSIFQMEEVDPRPRFTTKKKKFVRINPTNPSSIEPYEGFNGLNV